MSLIFPAPGETLRPIRDEGQPSLALANAVMLASHPWLLHLAGLDVHPSLATLLEELADGPLWTASTSCLGERHSTRANGTVWYSKAGVCRDTRSLLVVVPTVPAQTGAQRALAQAVAD